MPWLTKIKRYGGGESVIGMYSIKDVADHHAAVYNDDYQTDVAYVEEYDTSKIEWPSHEDAIRIAKNIKNLGGDE